MHILFPYLARYKAINWTRYHHLFTQLAALGHRITVLQPPPAALVETNFQEIEVELPSSLVLSDVAVPDWLWRRKWPRDKLVRKGIYGLCCRAETRRIVAEDRPDVLLVYNLPHASLLRIKPTPGKKLLKVFDLADDYEAMLATELGPFAFKPVINYGNRTLRRMLSDADLLLSISHSIAHMYPEHDIEVLPNGVDFERFTTVMRQMAESRNARPVIGYLGAFEYFIDLDLILETAQRLPQYIFRLIGDGRELGAVRAKVAALGLDNVELPGPVPFDKVPAEIAGMDVCLNLFKRIPISHKACPIKLFEYLAMGKPVLTTALDEIDSYRIDFLLKIGDAQEAAAAIEQVLSDREDGRRRGEAGRRWVEESYDWGQLARRFMTLVETSLERKA